MAAGDSTPASSAAPVPGSPASLMADANALRLYLLREAHMHVRQLQIACAKGAAPLLLIQALPREARAFLAWLGVLPSDPAFSPLVDRVLDVIERNQAMTLPPYSFSPADDAFCNVPERFFLAHFTTSAIFICPRMVDPSLTGPTTRALVLIHELFHHPDFHMSHPADASANSQNCGRLGSEEAVSNPYCVTNIIGQLGGGDQVAM